jgi:nitric oxide dioxygenase
MLSPEHTAIIKMTVPVLQQHGETITRHFYQRLFDEHPEVREYFNKAHQASGKQQRALAGAILAYAAHIDRLEALKDALPLIITKHAALGILPEHYPLVGASLLGAIRDVLGAAATDEIIEAWANAYQQLAEVLIAAEEQVYRENEERTGGWRGVRRFRVARREAESELITSFYLEPEDGGALLSFTPGQYVTVVLDIAGQAMRRTYSLSDSPGLGYYRISVKREPGGVASAHIHDHVHVGDVLELLPPNGSFTLQPGERPIVFVTGGVGITPAISMLNTAAATGRPIHFIHAAKNSLAHAFRTHVEAVAVRHDNVRACFLYDEPLAHDDARLHGRVTEEVLAERLPADRDVDLYFLGPKPFMQAVNRMARSLGIPSNQVRYEFFGPLEALDG